MSRWKDTIPRYKVETRTSYFFEKKINLKKYWEVYYEPDFSKSEKYFEERLRELLIDSVKSHMVSDVPIGAYISGGHDSSSIGSIANSFKENDLIGFTGKFSKSGHLFDESKYASAVAKKNNFKLKSTDIQLNDFVENLSKVIYH